MSVFCSVEEAIAELRMGNIIIVVDDEDRENEGDIVCLAEKVTPEMINFMAVHARGLKLWVYTVDAKAHARALVALGVDGLISNRPAAMRAALAAKSR